jgi:pimeloyl-ACP methyl ester carboxylesterase
MRSALIAAAVTGLAAAAPAPAPETAPDPALDVYLKPQTLAVLPDGRHYNLFCLGHNGPTVLLDAGASSWSTSWRKLQPDMARTTRVCAIDRPGFNFSDPGPLPRDVAAEAADLHAALQAAGLRPPYILVGHSYAA